MINICIYLFTYCIIAILQAAKKDFRKYYASQRKTGGGVGLQLQDIPHVSRRVVELLPQEFQRVRNAFDDDACVQQQRGMDVSFVFVIICDVFACHSGDGGGGAIPLLNSQFSV